MGQTSVMVVEDEPIEALGMRTQLQGMGYDVPAVVSYGEDAVHQAAELRPDVVLMDVRLKGEMDGVEAAHRIQSESDIPVVYVTAFADPDILRRAESAAFGYVLKPYSKQELQGIIEMALTKHRMEQATRAYAARVERSNVGLALVRRLMEDGRNGQDLVALLGTACRGIADMFEAPYSVAMHLEQDGRTARLIGEFLLHEQWQSLEATVQVEGTPLLRHVLARREPWVLDDITEDPHLAWLARRFPISEVFSLLVLPLIVDDQVIGGFALALPRQRGFAGEDIDLGWIVAQQVALIVCALWSDGQDRLHAAIEQTAEAVLLSDRDGQIFYVNHALQRLTGYAMHELLGQSPRLFREDKQPDQAGRALDAALEAGAAWQGRLVCRRKDGSQYTAEVTVTPVRAPDGEITHYVSVQRDVTQAVAREEGHCQARKMEAVGQLARGVAHDFNNLLTAINGNASLLAEGMIDDQEEVREVGQAILGAGQQAAELTRRLLTFTRKQVHDPRLVSLNDVVFDMGSQLKHIAGDQIAVQTQLDPELWPTHVDPVQIERVLTHLALNARDAMPHGGQLTLGTARTTLPEAESSYGLRAGPGDYVVLSVQDTGTGMSEEVQAHLFEPFFTTKDVGQGTGLGLATVHGIVEQCNGMVEVQSAEGQGTLFRVYLPRAGNRNVTRELPDLHAMGPRGQETILLVEDDESIFELTRRVLARCGYQLLVARDGLEAEQVAARHEGPIDLLLTDLTMPRMDGKTLARRLNEARPDLKIMLMSGYAGAGPGAQEERIKGTAFIQKPFRPQDLLEQVRALLDQ